MNRLVFNYKFHVGDVVDARTINGVLDAGFRFFMHRHFQLAGIELPDVKRIKDVNERKKAESILLYPSAQPKQPHGRTIIVATHVPNRYGRCLVNAYVPCVQESFDHPHLTRRTAGYVLINVVHYMHHLGERGYDLAIGKEVLEICEPYDFDK